MATITAAPFVRHLSAGPTSYVLHTGRGVAKHEGTAQAFWFCPLDAAISEVPLDDREIPVLVTLRTTDLQQLTAPATVTYRIADARLAAARVDFSVDLRSGGWSEEPLEAIAAMLHGATTAAVASQLADMTLDAALRTDLTALGAEVGLLLAADPRVTQLGIEVVGVRFALLRPDPDVERALQTPARERIQEDADKATFSRRALAVEREAAIGENELANQIELARRHEELIARKGTNARRQAEEAAAAEAIATQSSAARVRLEAEARADAARVTGEAEAAAERAKLDAHRDIPQEVLMTLALTKLAENLPAIERLTITPDMLSEIAGSLLHKDS